MNKVYCTLLLLFTLTVQAQDIKINAYSIVNNASTEMICESPTSAIRKESYTITILNEKGRDAAHFSCMCDKFSSLHRFAGEILDTNGKSIRKIKKSELKMTEDSITLQLPDGYTIESLPKPKMMSERFGSFRSSILVNGKEIHIVHRLLMHRGTFPKDAYEEFVDFRKQVAERYNGKIILRKE